MPEWTAPDPLDNTAWTRSIYMTEIQDATKDAYLNAGFTEEDMLQVISDYYDSLGIPVEERPVKPAGEVFLDQSIGKYYLIHYHYEMEGLLSYEELMEAYGFESYEDILGHEWTPHVTIDGIENLSGYERINDYRIVLDALMGFNEIWQRDYQIAKTYYKVRVNTIGTSYGTAYPIVDIDIDLPIYITEDTSLKKWFVGRNEPGYRWLTTVNQSFSTWIEGDGYSEVKIIEKADGDKKIQFYMQGYNWETWNATYHWLRSLVCGINPVDLETPDPYGWGYGYNFPIILELNENLCHDFDFDIELPGSWGATDKVKGTPIRIEFQFGYKKFLFYYLRPDDYIPWYNDSFGINCGGKIHFTRNIYEDYCTVYGVPDPHYPMPKIRQLIITSTLDWATYCYDGVTYKQTVTLDNIAVKNIATPDITPIVGRGTHDREG